MKKINLFLWGIVSTCITFFYRTEICAALYTETAEVQGDARDNCDGYTDGVNDGHRQLDDKYKYNNPMHTLCDSNEIFLGCYRKDPITFARTNYLLSQKTMETMAQNCALGSGICTTGCRFPGSQQTKSDPTYMRTKVCIVFCSVTNPVTKKDFPKDEKGNNHYTISWCAIPNDGTAFININRKSNTCAINAGTGFEDDTGEGVYADNCFYTE